MTEFNPGGSADLNEAVRDRYEANANRNAFTDDEKSKLAGIDAGAQVNPGPATTEAAGLMSAQDKAALEALIAATDKPSNWAATSNPTASEDETENFEVGSFWLNTSDERLFIALEVTEGSAVWREIFTEQSAETAATFEGLEDSDLVVLSRLNEGQRLFGTVSVAAMTDHQLGPIADWMENF